MAGHSDLNPKHQERRGEEGEKGLRKELLVGCTDIHYNHLFFSGDRGRYERRDRLEEKRAKAGCLSYENRPFISVRGATPV